MRRCSTFARFRIFAGLALVAVIATGLGGFDAAAAPETPDPKAEAFELYQQSRKAYAEGRFTEAAQLIRSAQALDPDPILTYNLARALEAAGQAEAAISTYQLYLRERPDAPDRGFVEGRIALITKQQSERAELEKKLQQAQADSTDARARARALAEEANEHARAGRYDVAVRLYRESYIVEPDPMVLFRLGKALEALGETSDAKQAFQTFLDAAPRDPNAPEARRRLAALARDSGPAVAPSNTAGIAGAGLAAREPSVAPIVVTSVGVAGLVGAAVLSGLAVNKHDAWQRAASQADAVSTLDTADNLALGANVALGIGAALTVFGGVWWILDRVGSDTDSGAVSAAVAPAPAGTGAQVIVQF